jgi:hypothetical protein
MRTAARLAPLAVPAVALAATLAVAAPAHASAPAAASSASSASDPFAPTTGHPARHGAVATRSALAGSHAWKV